MIVFLLLIQGFELVTLVRPKLYPIFSNALHKRLNEESSHTTSKIIPATKTTGEVTITETVKHTMQTEIGVESSGTDVPSNSYGCESILSYRSQLTTIGRLYLSAVIITMTLIVILLLRTLKELFSLYAEGFYFDRRITQSYQYLALYIGLIWIGNIIFTVVNWMFVHLWISADKIAISSTLDFDNLFVAFFMLLLSRIMAEGERIQEEQTLTV